MKKELIQDKQNEIIIANLRRIWLALRRQLGENDTLINDFRANAEQILNNSVYDGEINEETFNDIMRPNLF